MSYSAGWACCYEKSAYEPVSSRLSRFTIDSASNRVYTTGVAGLLRSWGRASTRRLNGIDRRVGIVLAARRDNREDSHGLQSNAR